MVKGNRKGGRSSWKNSRDGTGPPVHVHCMQANGMDGTREAKAGPPDLPGPAEVGAWMDQSLAVRSGLHTATWMFRLSFDWRRPRSLGLARSRTVCSGVNHVSRSKKEKNRAKFWQRPTVGIPKFVFDIRNVQPGKSPSAYYSVVTSAYFMIVDRADRPVRCDEECYFVMDGLGHSKNGVSERSRYCGRGGQRRGSIWPERTNDQPIGTKVHLGSIFDIRRAWCGT